MPVRRRRDGESGQSLAEFAIVAPLLFLLLFGVIQLGLLMGAQNGLTNGVRESARRAATYRVNDQSLGGAIFNAVCNAVELELTNRLRKEMPGFVPDAARLNSTIEYEWVADPTGGQYSVTMHVTVQYRAPIYVPLVGYALNPSDPSNFVLSASEQMRVENPPMSPIDLTTQTC